MQLLNSYFHAHQLESRQSGAFHGHWPLFLHFQPEQIRAETDCLRLLELECHPKSVLFVLLKILLSFSFNYVFQILGLGRLGAFFLDREHTFFVMDAHLIFDLRNYASDITWRHIQNLCYFGRRAFLRQFEIDEAAAALIPFVF